MKTAPKAAAATIIVGNQTGAAPSKIETVTLNLDHPFIFLIRETNTGTILFMGQYAGN